MSDNDILETEDGFEYSIKSETTDEDYFIKVCEDEHGEEMELPKEDDGTVLLSTVRGQFPNAVGLRYMSVSGCRVRWRGVRIVDGVLKPPQATTSCRFFVTMRKESTKLKTHSDEEEETKEEEKGQEDEEKEEEDLLQDMFVSRLHRDITDDELKDHFTKTCGEVALAEVKYDGSTGRSRGFGFVRFNTVEAAKQALTTHHAINGHKLEVRISRKQETPCQLFQETPCKLFIGRLPERTTRSDLLDYFSTYGEITDAYVRRPFRGFGFVTYASTNIARSILRLNHEIKGSRLNVTVAGPKEEKMRRSRRYQDGNEDRNDYRRRSSYDDSREQLHHEGRYDPRSSRRDSSPPRAPDMMNELKQMLFDVMNQQRR